MFAKFFKDKSDFVAKQGLDLFPAFIPVWLFLGFPLLSSISVHDCVIDDKKDDQYYTSESIWEIHSFTNVDEEVE